MQKLIQKAAAVLLSGAMLLAGTPVIPAETVSVRAASVQADEPAAPAAETTAPVTSLPQTTTAVTTTTAKSSASKTTTSKTTTSKSSTSKTTTSKTTTSKSSASKTTTSKTTTSKSSVSKTTTSKTTTSKSSTSKTTTSKTTTAKTTTTATTTSETTTTTTTTAAPSLALKFSDSYPGGDTVMQLVLNNNFTGLRAFSCTITLPEGLTPDVPEPETAAFTAGKALDGATALAFYNAAGNTVSVVYAAEKAGAVSPDLGSMVLHIARDAEVGKAYTVTVVPEKLADGSGKEMSAAKRTAAFKPTAPLRRTLSDTALTLSPKGTYQLKISPEPPAGSCVWQSSDPARISVNENGEILALRAGQVTVTAVCETLEYQCSVTSYLRGDIDDSLNVDLDDAIGVLQAYTAVSVLHEEMPLTELQLLAADIDGDKAVTMDDAISVLRYYTMILNRETPYWDDEKPA